MNNMNNMSNRQRDGTTLTRQGRLGLPFIALIGLALLGAPRVVLHDLDIINEGTVVNSIFVFLPPLIWVVVAVLARVPSPLLTLLVVGVLSGAVLALSHQFLWDISFGDNPPLLGGNLAGLDPVVQSLIIRGFAVLSGLVTGLLVGLVSGLVAWGISVAIRRHRRP